MKIRKGDTVKVRAGKDAGKTGKVLQVFPKLGRASVAGINIAYKHLRPRRRDQTGQRIEFPAPLPISRLALVCPHCGQGTRVGVSKSPDGKSKQRWCKKCRAAF